MISLESRVRMTRDCYIIFTRYSVFQFVQRWATRRKAATLFLSATTAQAVATPFRQDFKLALNDWLISCRITDNSIPATAFRDIKAQKAPGERDENETERGLRVSDKVSS